MVLANEEGSHKQDRDKRGRWQEADCCEGGQADCRGEDQIQAYDKGREEEYKLIIHKGKEDREMDGTERNVTF